MLIWTTDEIDMLSTFESSRSAEKVDCGVSGSDGPQKNSRAKGLTLSVGGLRCLVYSLVKKELLMTKMDILHSLYLCSNPSSKIPISPSNLSIHLPVCSCPFKSALLSFANNTVAVPALWPAVISSIESPTYRFHSALPASSKWCSTYHD